MTIREYALNLLKESGCDETSYRGATVEQAIEDAKWYENEYGKQPFTAEDIGKELVLICNNERLEPLPPPRSLENDFDDYGSWGIGDMRNSEDTLREVIASGDRFDTGWHGWKKECQSMRITRTEDAVIIEVHMEMDDIDDCALIFDCLTNDEEAKITEEQCEAIKNALFEDVEFSTEASRYEALEVDATYEQIMTEAKKLMNYCDQELKESFCSCIATTLTTLYAGNMGKDELEKLINDRFEERGH